MKEFFWTDSRVLLGYINNEAKRFHVYVANRVQQMRHLTDPNAWFYVDTNNNPSDKASMGLTAKQLVEGSLWLTAPEFLGRSGPCEPENVELPRLQALRKTSLLYKLDPFVDHDGIIRVGGRIRRADTPVDLKHSFIIPQKGHLTELLIQHHHLKLNHMGRGMTHNELRQSGYLLINGSSKVARFISSCVTCRRLRRPTEQQKMACLPDDRLEC